MIGNVNDFNILIYERNLQESFGICLSIAFISEQNKERKRVKKKKIMR